MKKLAPTLAAAALLAACASNPPAQTPAPPPPALTPAQQPAQPATSAALDPLGIFDFTTAVEGMSVAGTITITKPATGTGYTGTITTNVTEPIGISRVVVEGQKLIVTAQTPDGDLTFTMEFKGNDFTGTWAMPGMSGTHAGVRRKS